MWVDRRTIPQNVTASSRYVPDFEEYKSTKGKSPWITVNGIDVADSQLAIEYLIRTLGKVSNIFIQQRQYCMLPSTIDYVFRIWKRTSHQKKEQYQDHLGN